MLEDALEFECPYCLAAMSISVDLTEGRRQKFVYDCQTCCRPIHLEVRVGEEGLIEDFQALAENE
ncbi:MAG TPA: CPXCG motif-containing cysteine-rich protein [Verrucomicrobiae bacterium]|jgi:hypothetical protein|nr:CPXCG motif-containing cysteine-rich protein [Verrucomicrobiae bacterium]